MSKTSSQTIFCPGQEATIQEIGGKAWALNQLGNTDVEIPRWIALPTQAFYDSMSPSQSEHFKHCNDAEELAILIQEVKLKQDIQQALQEYLDHHWADDVLFAVRSSSTEEDHQQHSYAGQFDSFLNVPKQQLFKKILQVWQSAFSERILAYQQSQQLLLHKTPPAVIIQEMVDARVAGIAFGANPVSGSRKEFIINAVSGLADRLVSGEVNADSYTLKHDGQLLDSQIIGAHALLSATQLIRIGQLLKHCQRCFHAPQDIEWALSRDQQLLLLQSRPISSIRHLPDPDGALTIWDNSNIIESYGGVTTPLTFSFIRYAYSEVYQALCRILGVSDAAIQNNRHVFNNMLGLLNGRVYYNLINWYRVLALLPGFTVTHKFMEQMMGVKEGLPQDILQQVQSASTLRKFIDLFAMLRSLLGLLSNHWRLKRKIRRFYQRLDKSLELPVARLEQMRADELVAYYYRLEQQLLSRWDAPLVNDFLAMIFYGLLRKLATRWGADSASLQNELLTSQGGIISAEPIRYIQRMAAMARNEPGLIQLLHQHKRPFDEQRLAAWPQFNQLLQEYLDRFGDRCLEELKLESLTTREDPATLLSTVAFLAQQKAASEPVTPPISDSLDRLHRHLRWRPLRRLLFHWVLKHARARVRDRENLRFERTRVFGRVRLLYLELGKRLYAQGLLEQVRDVFYLESHEILGMVEGTNTSVALQAIINIRKQEYDLYRSGEPLPGRVKTNGGVHFGNNFYARESEVPEPTDGRLQGLGCCPGVVEGRARVIIDPRKAKLEPGEILIARYTDPGWVMLFASAAAIVVERGSMLSHTAIVAREMNIPAIVAVPNLLDEIRDGDTIRIDGAQGIIEHLNKTQ